MFVDTYKTVEIMLSYKETEALKIAIEVLEKVHAVAFYEVENAMQSGENKLSHEDFELAIDILNLIKEESRWYLEE